mmetsp:Transcript_44928/g.124957  ORF Transcript_44928/g.124957 Transcript_44928/m.124957 type:complete len:234 (-) Transcript_44928:192-893(-)
MKSRPTPPKRALQRGPAGGPPGAQPPWRRRALAPDGSSWPLVAGGASGALRPCRCCWSPQLGPWRCPAKPRSTAPEEGRRPAARAQACGRAAVARPGFAPARRPRGPRCGQTRARCEGSLRGASERASLCVHPAARASTRNQTHAGFPAKALPCLNTCHQRLMASLMVPHGLQQGTLCRARPRGSRACPPRSNPCSTCQTHCLVAHPPAAMQASPWGAVAPSWTPSTLRWKPS